MKIKRVAVYETSDGETFADKKLAQAHQKHLDRLEHLESLVRDAFQLQDVGYLDGITAEDMAQTILDNAELIRTILPQRAKTVEAVPAEAQAEPEIA